MAIVLRALTVQTHASDAIRFHRFEWACCSMCKYNFQIVRDDAKQSDWPLPGKIAPHLHRIQHFPTFIGRVAQNGGLRHNGLAPIEMHGFKSRVAHNCVMGFHHNWQSSSNQFIPLQLMVMGHPNQVPFSTAFAR